MQLSEEPFWSLLVAPLPLDHWNPSPSLLLLLQRGPEICERVSKIEWLCIFLRLTSPLLLQRFPQIPHIMSRWQNGVPKVRNSWKCYYFITICYVLSVCFKMDDRLHIIGGRAAATETRLIAFALSADLLADNLKCFAAATDVKRAFYNLHRSSC